MAKRSYDFLFKLLLIGDSGVGKTCIIFRFSDEVFSTSFIPTIGIDFKIKTIEVRGKKIKLQIWDTAGQERYAPLLSMYYRNADICICMFDASNHSSLIELEKLFPKLSPDTKIIVLGNKIDLLNNFLPVILNPLNISKRNSDSKIFFNFFMI